jgi:cytochrome P450
MSQKGRQTTMPDSATPRLIRDDSRNSWIAKDASTVQAVFTSSACHVRPTAEPVPSAFLGTPAGEIYRRLVRMNDGAFHAARKPALERALGGVNLDHVRAECDRWAIRMMNEATHPVDVDHLLFDLPTATLASVLGVPDADVPELLPQVRDFALSIPGGASADQLGQGILAAGYLLRLFQRLLPIAPSGSFLASLQREMRYVGETDPDTTIANTIGFFFQAYEGTAGLVASALIAIAANEPSETPDDVRAIGVIIAERLRNDPPVPAARRFVAEETVIAGQNLSAGDVIVLMLGDANRCPHLAGMPDSFSGGSGPHACPGQAIARAIAETTVRNLVQAGICDQPFPEPIAFRPSGVARIPLLNRQILPSALS